MFFAVVSSGARVELLSGGDEARFGGGDGDGAIVWLWNIVGMLYCGEPVVVVEEKDSEISAFALAAC